MEYKIRIKTKKILSDTITPVSIYLKVRDAFPKSLLLESSDYHSNQNSYSFICLKEMAFFKVHNGRMEIKSPTGESNFSEVIDKKTVPDKLYSFTKSFKNLDASKTNIDGLFGYSGYDAIEYYEDIKLKSKKFSDIPEVYFSFYKYIVSINHMKNELVIIENLIEGVDEISEISEIENLIKDKNYSTFKFETEGAESSNITDDEYIDMVKKGKEHCFRGDVFQIVLSRQFSQGYRGDDFNVYRALRSINPSPYLFYFDYGSYRIFGSSPETQVEIKNGKAYINPIAGTFKRTGDDIEDAKLAQKLSNDKKENAEHIMLVDLARNDLSRTCTNVKVERYREVQYYSHVLHMVSKVSGELEVDANTIKIYAESFPAGTLSGAPKYKAMELIDKYENQRRGYYGGAIGYIRLNGDINQAIMIRSFFSKDNKLYYQAGAGVVSESNEISELNEVNNKLAALKKAIEFAVEL